jgi:saccharopine dehydrogenase-like NADP-dependent oxidoreductase
MKTPTRFVVLGAGGMGRYAAKTAANFDFVDEIVVADRDAAAAARVCEGSAKMRPTTVDVTDESALSQLLGGATAVLNTVGPFFQFGPRVMRAALSAGCDYADINDDWESTESLLAMHDEARARGVTALVGMGSSPGISNLLAVLAMRELDTVSEIYLGFDVDAAIPETRGTKPSAATIHGVHQLTGRIRVFDGGNFVDQAPMRRVDVDYPGLGRGRGWTMGHPEAITLPRSHPALRRCMVLMSTTRSNVAVMRVLRLLVDSGILSLERAAGWIERFEGVGKPIKSSADHLHELTQPGSQRLPPLFAVARGTRGGVEETAAATLTSAPAGGMGGATGVPLALSLALTTVDPQRRRGVFAPEELVDPVRFFDLLAPICTPRRNGHGELVLLSRSWERRDLRADLRAPEMASARSSESHST